MKLSFFVYVGANQGVVPREVVAEYTKANPNVTIELYEGTNAETYPKMVAARKTTPDQPIVNFGFVNADANAKGDVDDLWESLDPANVPTLNNVLDGFKRKDNKGIAWGMVGVGLMYNTDNVKTPPSSWMDFWDPRFKGRLALSRGGHYLSGLVTTIRAQGGKERHVDGIGDDEVTGPPEGVALFAGQNRVDHRARISVSDTRSVSLWS